MGEVWIAEHAALSAPVAVKFMDVALVADADARRRFESEAKAAAALRSPHVVHMLDYGIEEGAPYIVMELLDGETLEHRLKGVERLDLVTASKILTQACKALELAGDAGIVHRDLKPANLFLARSGREEIVKILDFGVAKFTATPGDTTSSGRLLGSPHYMSPEQARGGLPVDHKSDLWSMGVILFELVTGERPFDGPAVGDVLLQICTEPVHTPRSVHAELPEWVDDYFKTALARDPAARFESAAAMAEEFARGVTELDGAAKLHTPLVAPAERVEKMSTTSSESTISVGGATTRSVELPMSRNFAGIALAALAAVLIGVWIYSREEPRVTAAPSEIASESPSVSATATPITSASASVTTAATTSASATPSSAKPRGPERHRILGY